MQILPRLYMARLLAWSQQCLLKQLSAAMLSLHAHVIFCCHEYSASSC